MNNDRWTVEWPRSPGDYWFYGWRDKKREKLPGKMLVKVRQGANALFYLADHDFMHMEKGAFGIWQKIEVDLPKQILFDACKKSPKELRFVVISFSSGKIRTFDEKQSYWRFSEFGFWGCNTPLGWLPSPGEIEACHVCGGLCTPDETVGMIEFAVKICDCPTLDQIEDGHGQEN